MAVLIGCKQWNAEGGVPYDAVNIRVNMWGDVGDAVPYK